MLTPEQLVGPFALTIALALIVKVLWDEHRRQDARTEAQVAAWQALVAAGEADLARLTDVLERLLGERLHRP